MQSMINSDYEIRLEKEYKKVVNSEYLTTKYTPDFTSFFIAIVFNDKVSEARKLFFSAGFESGTGNSFIYNQNSGKIKNIAFRIGTNF